MVVKTLNSFITCAFVHFFSFSPPLPRSSFCKANQSLYLCAAESDAMRGEAHELGWGGTCWKAKGKGVVMLWMCLEVKAVTRSGSRCAALGSDLSGADITHKWSQWALGMPWGPLAFRGCCQKKQSKQKCIWSKAVPKPLEIRPQHFLLTLTRQGVDTKVNRS